MKIALIIGHNSKSQGLFSKYLNSTEFAYNTRVANLVKSELPNNITVFNRYRHNSYNAEMEELASRVNKHHFEIVLELHFNGVNGKANGVEALYFHKPEKGKALARSFCEAIVEEYGSFNRGAKPLSYKNQNGYGFVQKMKAPALILEPFFGDHLEAQKFIDVQRYSCTIVRWLESVRL